MRRADLISAAVQSVEPERHDWYREHFGAINPFEHDELFRMFLFARTTVNLSWESSVRLYDALQDLSWVGGPQTDLTNTIIECKTGLHNTISDSIYKFSNVFYDDPSLFYRGDETWLNYRDRLVKALNGLSITKVSFVIEMCWPQADVVCLDRHMLRGVFKVRKSKYGYQVGAPMYRKFEKEWVKACKRLSKLPGITRLAYWDSLQGYDNPLFWTRQLITTGG